MNHLTKRLILPLLLSLAQPLHAEPAPAGVPTDNRQLVEMPAPVRQLMRSDMVEHLTALNEVIGLLAEQRFTEAAEVAEQRIGRSAMGRHRTTGTPPGRYMSAEMRQLAWGMHDAASAFATTARDGDMDRTLAALQGLTAACAACHLSYRTR